MIEDHGWDGTGFTQAADKRCARDLEYALPRAEPHAMRRVFQDRVNAKKQRTGMVGEGL
jgi:hypothetical protein